MFDRVLLILLLLLLPLGIVVSRIVTGELSVGKNGAIEAQEKKIDALMEKVNQGVAATGSNQLSFTITGVLYATESGIITVAGVVPQPDAFIWTWTAATSIKNTKPESTEGAVIAKSVAWDGPLVIKPDPGGVFSLEVETKSYSGVVEIRLEQGAAIHTIRYDVTRRVQLN